MFALADSRHDDQDWQVTTKGGKGKKASAGSAKADADGGASSRADGSGNAGGDRGGRSSGRQGGTIDVLPLVCVCVEVCICWNNMFFFFSA
jgi:hypothetical protein